MNREKRFAITDPITTVWAEAICTERIGESESSYCPWKRDTINEEMAIAFASQHFKETGHCIRVTCQSARTRIFLRHVLDEEPKREA